MYQCSISFQQSNKDHITPSVLEAFLKLTKYLVQLPTGGALLKHLFDYILFNPGLWVHTSVEVKHLIAFLSLNYKIEDIVDSLIHHVGCKLLTSTV